MEKKTEHMRNQSTTSILGSLKDQTAVTILDSGLNNTELSAALVGRVMAEKKMICWGNVTGVLKWSWSKYGEVKILTTERIVSSLNSVIQGWLGEF